MGGTALITWTIRLHLVASAPRKTTPLGRTHLFLPPQEIRYSLLRLLQSIGAPPRITWVMPCPHPHSAVICPHPHSAVICPHPHSVGTNQLSEEPHPGLGWQMDWLRLMSMV